ncbi:hypothetical protein ACQEVZ_40020 [Dactylosporangium sp. CA-152071]|uniref:hypothetical protein n=1 Tax=Dactylosporangium sp. CA-152071 TaxID=3239933 RepID=UPI003D8A6F79
MPQEAAPHAERWEFVDAFVEHTRARPSADRLAAGLRGVLLFALVIVIGVIVAGLIAGLLGNDRKRRTAAAAPAAWTAVSGWDCRGSTDRQFEAFGRTDRWTTVPGGGWTGDGCRGAYVTVPVGSPSEGALWTFRPGFTAGRCTVVVYRPEAAPTQMTTYHVLAGRNGAVAATFQLDLAKAPTGWTDAGAFPLYEGALTVRLAASGGAPEPKDGRVVVSQIRVSCGRDG